MQCICIAYELSHSSTPDPCPPSPPSQKRSSSVESNEKSILWLLIFKLWLIVFTIYGWDTWILKCVTDQKNVQERCAMSWNVWKINFTIFSFWVMVDFELKMHRKFTNFECKNDHISKTKYRKIDFLFVSGHSVSFM